MANLVSVITDWFDWVLRNKGTFFTSLGGVATAIATVILAKFTIKITQANKRMIELSNEQFMLNERQFNRRFLSEPYEQIALLMTDTLETLRYTLAEVNGAATPFIPGSLSVVQKVVEQRERSKGVAIKLKLYPNHRVDPLVMNWMSTLIKVTNLLEGIANPRILDIYGDPVPSDPVPQEVISRVSSQINVLEHQHNSVLEAMSKELTV